MESPPFERKGGGGRITEIRTESSEGSREGGGVPLLPLLPGARSAVEAKGAGLHSYHRRR